MADFFFFTDPFSITGQDNGDNFGPLSNSVYRLDNLFNVTPNAKIYAICDSILIAQYNSTGNINLILKPISHPNLNIGRVAYYIYKNVKVSSLVNNIHIAPRTNNALTEKIWATQEINDLNNQTGPTTPSIKIIGLNYSNTGIEEDLVLNSDNLDSIIFKEQEFQFPLVKAGDFIANFEGGAVKAGFEIVIESLGGEETFETAREVDHKLQLTPPNVITPYEEFRYNHQKEKVLNYIDLVAFYGLLNSNSDNLKVSGTTTDPVQTDQILTHFKNKNRLYLDIRNQYNRSYNYYRLYGNSIKLSFDISVNSESMQVFHYYNENLAPSNAWGNWPIFIIENQTPVSLDVPSKISKFILKLPDDNTIIKYVYSQENTSSTFGKNNKFVKQSQDSNLALSAKVYELNGEYHHAAGYILLKIMPDKTKKIQGFFTTDQTTLSHVFPINRLKISDTSVNDVVIKTYYNATVIERINYPDNYGDLYAAQIGIAKDVNSITLFSYPNEDIGYISSDILNPNFTFINGRYKDAYDFLFLLTKLDPNLFFEYFTMESDPSFGVIIAQNAENDGLINKIVPNFLDTIQLSHTEYSDLLALISAHSLLDEFDIFLSYSKSETMIQHFPNYIVTSRKLLIQGFTFTPESNNEEIQMTSIPTPFIMHILTHKN